MTKSYGSDIVGFRVGKLLLCRSCFENKGLKNFDSLIRDANPESISYNCDNCHIVLFVWRPVQDFIKECEGWRRIKLREGSAPSSMLADRGVPVLTPNEEVLLKEKVLTRLTMTAVHRRWIKRKSSQSSVKTTVPIPNEGPSNIHDG